VNPKHRSGDAGEKGQTSKRYTDLAFQVELWHRTYNLSVTKVATSDPGARAVQQALARVFSWLRLKPAFEKRGLILHASLRDPGCSSAKKDFIQNEMDRVQHLYQIALNGAKLVAQKYSDALLDGDNAARVGLEKLIRIFEAHMETTADSSIKRLRPNWHFFAGIAALDFLRKGIVPTRKMLIARAIDLRARFELREESFDEAKVEARKAELQRQQPGNWHRILRDMDLRDLPEESQEFELSR
jgi:hypothetical protein